MRLIHYFMTVLADWYYLLHGERYAQCAFFYRRNKTKNERRLNYLQNYSSHLTCMLSSIIFVQLNSFILFKLKKSYFLFTVHDKRDISFK